MQDELRKLIERHCVTIAGEVEEIARYLSELRQGHSEASNLELAIEVAHRLKGSSGSIGFGEVSAAAAIVEARLKDQRAQAKAGERLELNPLLASFDALQRIGAGITPQGSALFNADVSRLF